MGRSSWRLGFLPTILILTLIGCGGKKLVPDELKDFLAQELKTDRHKVDVTQPFRTTIVLRIRSTTIVNARDSERELIGKFLDFSRQKGIKYFLNDSLMFLVRSDTDPNVNLKWWTTARDALEVLDGKMSDTDFIDRCVKEEHWPEELN